MSRIVMTGQLPSKPYPDGEPNPDASRSLLADEFRRLIQGGREILFACGWDGRRYAGFRPGGVEVLKFCRRAEALVRRTFGEDHRYHRDLAKLAAHPQAARSGFYVHEYVHVLERALADQQRDDVFHASTMMFDSLAGDCIEVAEALLNAGCHVSATKRAGVVLEQTIRRIGRSHGVDVDALAPHELNDALLERRICDDATHRRIGACLQIARDMRQSRQPAIPNVELDEMVRWVRAFALQHRMPPSDAEHSRQ
jgi:hypothetical protein